MAGKNDTKIKNSLDDLSSKSNMIIYGTDGTLDKEDAEIKNIVKQTIIGTKIKFGAKTNGSPINYFNELNIGNVFSEISGGKKKDADKLEATNSFKKYMTDNQMVDASSLLLSEQGRLINFANYKYIYNYISECAQALDVYKDNIMSPDDFTKVIFDITYDNELDENVLNTVEKQLNDIRDKYKIEEKADKIIGDTLMLGEDYIAVLSLENELNLMLSDPILGSNGVYNNRVGKALNENSVIYDADAINVKILSESVNINDEEANAFKEVLSENKDNSISEKKDIEKYIANAINENVSIGSKAEIILERVVADNDFNKNKGYSLKDIPGASINKTSKAKKVDDKPMYVNGSTIRVLDPGRTCELRIDDVCYGYYYVEDVGNNVANSPYLGPSTGREVNRGVNMGLNNNAPGTTTYTPANSAATQLGVSEQKLRVITDVFINQLATKVDKEFIRNNKNFKDFIYELVKQNYIIKRGIKMTYFSPNEVIKFEVPAIYRKIVFAAKLYLSVMTNDILVKLGRAHDKRVFYVETGLDQNYEQAINKVIDDIKRREYKMDNINDFNTILNLNPGRWDDYFIPTIGGNKPLEIDTLAGMDADLNSDFLQYLKNSMMAGMDVPSNLIDNLNDINFARTLSSQNSNFVRSVIRYQKLLTAPFTQLIQTLYRNEYKFNDKSEVNVDYSIDFKSIKVHFPSPAALNMTNISEQIQAADTNADFISSQLIQIKADGSNEESRIKLKSEIIKDLLPGINWKKYEKIKDKLSLEKEKEIVKNPPIDPMAVPGTDPYGQGIY